MNERVRSIGGMTLIGENESTPTKACPTGAFSIINATYTGLESKPYLRLIFNHKSYTKVCVCVCTSVCNG